MSFSGGKTAQERFDAKYMPVPEAGCWIWTGAVNCERGYGYFIYEGKPRLAHRASWSIHNGPIPDGANVLHRCDIPSCVNPNHLFLGTLSDNMKDCSVKGRTEKQQRTHCPRGHEYTASNTTWNHDGKHRECRECKNARNRLNYSMFGRSYRKGV